MNRKEVVVGIIIDDNKKVFLLRHNKCKGLCVFPSGKVEKGETNRDALFREMKEELGIDVLDYKKIYDSSQWYDRTDGIIHTLENVFIITDYVGVIHNAEPTKHLELIKVKTDEIINNPKDYAYSTYHYALLLKEQYNI